MKGNFLNRSAALVLGSAMGCVGQVDKPLDVDMTLSGYQIACADVTGEKALTPLNANYYCGEGQVMAEVAPSIYLSSSEAIRDALNCALDGLVVLQINNSIRQAPKPETLFLGGIAQEVANGEYSGKTVCGSDDHFYSLIVDHKPNGELENSCDVLMTALHELGHGLENKALLNGANYADYNLDKSGHEATWANTVMNPGAKCKTTTFNFSEGSARFITENLNHKYVHPEKLTGIETRCAEQIKKVIGQ